MSKRRNILIACPQYQRMVAGTYECNENGTYRTGPDGSFLIQRAKCSHYGGRCMQTLCILHRYNRGGDGSWFPARMVPGPEPKTLSNDLPEEKPSPKNANRKKSGGDSGLDILC